MIKDIEKLKIPGYFEKLKFERTTYFEYSENIVFKDSNVIIEIMPNSGKESIRISNLEHKKLEELYSYIKDVMDIIAQNELSPTNNVIDDFERDLDSEFFVSDMDALVMTSFNTEIDNNNYTVEFGVIRKATDSDDEFIGISFNIHGTDEPAFIML